jgi:hypothetical protein
MNQTTDNERYNVLNNYKNFDVEQIAYYYNRFTQRIEYLSPLLNELEIKKMDLNDICKPLAQEVWELKELIKFLELFKIKSN